MISSARETKVDFLFIYQSMIHRRGKLFTSVELGDQAPTFRWRQDYPPRQGKVGEVPARKRPLFAGRCRRVIKEKKPPTFPQPSLLISLKQHPPLVSDSPTNTM